MEFDESKVTEYNQLENTNKEVYGFADINVEALKYCVEKLSPRYFTPSKLSTGARYFYIINVQRFRDFNRPLSELEERIDEYCDENHIDFSDPVFYGHSKKPMIVDDTKVVRYSNNKVLHYSLFGGKEF